MTDSLFEPFEINGMQLKNRIGFAPMLNMPSVMSEFSITDQTVHWFEERARGGAGLIMTGPFLPMLFKLRGLQHPGADQ